MTTYDKPSKTLMLDFIKEKIVKGQVFDKKDAVDWFAKHYPKLNPNTVKMDVECMAVNNPTMRRRIEPNSGYDLFFKVGAGKFRLWDSTNDPQPLYMTQGRHHGTETTDADELTDDIIADQEEKGISEFAFERDLRNYLAKNLFSLEKGLELYQDEGFTGIEFPAGGRFIDILAVNKEDFVVIELKVSRGHDRVIGQLLRYMGWIKANLATGKKVRGMIVASDITEDLKLAASLIPDVKLVEYEISFKIKSII
jgi:hypothetical protein